MRSCLKGQLFSKRKEPMKSQLRGHLFAIITISIWSSTFIISKMVLTSLDPLQVLLIRYMMAVVFLFLLYPKFERPKSWREELLFLCIGASLVGYFVFENSALQRTYSSNVSLIVATIPLMTGVLSIWLLKSGKMTVKNTIGFIIAYAGVAVVIINGSSLEGVNPLGDLLAFGAAVMFAIYTVIMEKSKQKYHLIQKTRKVFIYGLMVLIGMFFFAGESFSHVVWHRTLIGSLLYLGIVASSLAFIMWNDAIHCIGPIRTNLYIYLVPVMTTVFAYLILGEKITGLTLLGTVGILAGLYLSEHKEDKVDDDKEALWEK